MDDRIFYVKTYLKELLVKVKEQSLLDSKFNDTLIKIINRIDGSYYEEHLLAHDDVSDYIEKVFDDIYMFNVRDLQNENMYYESDISDFSEDDFKYIDFLMQCMDIKRNKLEEFYSSFLLSIRKFVLKDALRIAPIVIYQKKLKKLKARFVL